MWGLGVRGLGFRVEGFRVLWFTVLEFTVPCRSAYIICKRGDIKREVLPKLVRRTGSFTEPELNLKPEPSRTSGKKLGCCSRAMPGKKPL